MMNIPLVAIRCLVYNHAPYLRECLDGFIMQKTTFPFVVIVHDDASIDTSTEIIREYEIKYPQIVKPIYEKENQYSKKDGSLGIIVDDAVLKCQAKYIAFCEGDDYWTDAYKLQKQVDFLEKHVEYGMICGDAYSYVQRTKQFDEIMGKKGDEKFENLFKGFSDLNAPTVLMRSKLYLECVSMLKPLYQFDLFFDTAIWYWFALNSNIYFMKEEKPMVVYRVLENSASHSTNLLKSLNMQQRYFNLKIAFMTIVADFSDDKFQWMLKEIIDCENEIIQYAQYIKELCVRNSKRYRMGHFFTKLLTKHV